MSKHLTYRSSRGNTQLTAENDDTVEMHREWDEQGRETSRPYTEEEKRAARDRQDGGRRIRADADLRDRLRTLRQSHRDYLNLTSPTAAQQRTQLDKITRGQVALLRLLLQDLDGED